MHLRYFTFILCTFVLCAFASWVAAEEVTVQVYALDSNIKKATRLAIQSVSFTIMEKLIEPAKLKAQKKQIQKLISTRYNRYIVYTKSAVSKRKAGEKVKTEVVPNETVICPGFPSPNCAIPPETDYFILSITIGYSEQNLKKILLEEDLFYTGRFSQRILPLVYFNDSMQRTSYGWWMKKDFEDSALKPVAEAFYGELQAEWMPYGFYLLNPERGMSRHFIPNLLKFNQYKKYNIFTLANFFKAPLVLTGLVKVSESGRKGTFNLKLQLGIFHTESKRQLTETERLEKVVADSSENALKILPALLKKRQVARGLGVQLKALYHTGRISSRLLKITLNGPLTYRQLKRFKKKLLLAVSAIQGLQETLIRHHSVTFLADTRQSEEQVLKAIKAVKISPFRIKVTRVRAGEITLFVGVK